MFGLILAVALIPVWFLGGHYSNTKCQVCHTGSTKKSNAKYKEWDELTYNISTYLYRYVK